MTAACLAPGHSRGGYSDFGATASKVGEWLRSQALNDFAFRLRHEAKPEVPPSLEVRLQRVLNRAREVVFEQARYLDDEKRTSLIASLEQLISIEEWDEDDDLLSVGSVRTMIRTIIALDDGVGDLTVSRNGQLVSTWHTDSKIVRVEAKADGTVAWTVLHPRGSQPRHQHTSNSSIEDLKATLAGLWSRAVLVDGEDLPPEATIILHVSGGKTRPHPRSPQDPCKAIDADALKCDEDGISVTWVEYFDGDEAEKLRLASLAMTSDITVRKSGYIARITVAELLAAMEDEACDVRVVANPLDDNPAHCLIKGIDADDVGAKMVAAEAFTDFVPVTAISGLL